MEEDGFQLVSRRKGAKARKENIVKPFSSADNEQWNENKIDACKTRLEAARHELRSTALLEGVYGQIGAVVDLWRKSGVLCSCTEHSAASEPTSGGGLHTQEERVSHLARPLTPNCHVPANTTVDLVCYGIGPFAQSSQARLQMALLLLIREFLQAQQLLSRCLLYDPILQEGEAKVAESLGAELMETNEEGRRLACRPTLFFMPHCGRSLYENVLSSNWQPQSLHLVCIVGNGFSTYLERMPTHIFRSETPYLALAQAIVSETKVEAKEHADSFNDTALHLFHKDRIPEEGSSFWTCAKGNFQDDDHVAHSELSSWRWMQ